MAYRVTGEGYSAFFREEEDGREIQADDSDDGYTCLLCNTSYEKDLQLAAELGKTLLERNKELETSLRQHQNVIEDQTQEIEYLTKQTAALREVNDSRLRIYEQLEVSIQDLERANQRLTVDNSADKKHIKSLCAQIDSLESRCEELQKSVDEMTVAQETVRRRQRRSVCTPDEPVAPKFEMITQNTLPPSCESSCDEEVTQLLQQLQESKTQRSKEQRRIQDLEEQTQLLIQENTCLEEQLIMLTQKEEDMKSLQEELTTLEEIRQGHLCRRCLRETDERSLTAEDDDDDISVIDSLVNESHRNSVLMQLQESLGESVQGDNPYRDLVEKYEALLKVQRHPGIIRPPQTVSSNNCLSLQEELQLSGDFSSFHKDDEDVDSEGETRMPQRKEPLKSANGKAFSATPTDFSEAETSSSGFYDETSNKVTQTDFPPGSFLCTISDGDDCKFSIYDDASPVESRFRKTPEYRQLFREIFAVLKRAAEAKDEGEKLPLLDDFTPICEELPKVPPVTPAREDPPSDIPDPEEELENSVISDEPSEDYTVETMVITNSHISNVPYEICQEVLEVMTNVLDHKGSMVNTSMEKMIELEEKKKPTRDILEYLSSGVGSKKKSNSKKHSPRTASEPVTAVVGMNAKVSYTNKVTRRKKEVRMNDSPCRTPERSSWCVSAGSDLSNNLRKEENIPNEHRHSSVWDSHPLTSAASQVATLKMLEKSYAEVLRQTKRPKGTNRVVTANRK
uniref:Cerebellar degeneration-related protein 2-like n=1 Tax=Clastoptera arizonana TaxID=38151 RepID=A0A1B6DP59_9HEMI